MEYLAVNGGKRLGGHLNVQGAKNSALPILIACALVKDEVVLHNVPLLSDTDNTLKILRYLGAEVRREGHTVTVNAKALNINSVPEEMMREMRSSILFLGALSSRLGSACVSLPGGCAIGARPINWHLRCLVDLNAVITLDGEQVCCSLKNAEAGKVCLPFPSVGATENILLASVLLQGTTVLYGAAREPEIVDLCQFLNAAGARIYGAGSDVITVHGVRSLHSAEFTVMPDRIHASTLLLAASATGSSIELRRVVPYHFEPVLEVLMQSGCRFLLEKNRLRITSPKRLRRIRRVVTKPYPGFPTDVQAPLSAALCVAKGTSRITETLFENRFMHLAELKKFGAHIRQNGNTAFIYGRETLSPAEVSCTDLRGGAAVLLAALCAEGESRVLNITHLDRGYEHIEHQLTALGADVKRVKDEKQ